MASSLRAVVALWLLTCGADLAQGVRVVRSDQQQQLQQQHSDQPLDAADQPLGDPGLLEKEAWQHAADQGRGSGSAPTSNASLQDLQLSPARTTWSDVHDFSADLPQSSPLASFEHAKVPKAAQAAQFATVASASAAGGGRGPPAPLRDAWAASARWLQAEAEGAAAWTRHAAEGALADSSRELCPLVNDEQTGCRQQGCKCAGYQSCYPKHVASGTPGAAGKPVDVGVCGYSFSTMTLMACGVFVSVLLCVGVLRACLVALVDVDAEQRYANNGRLLTKQQFHKLFNERAGEMWLKAQGASAT